MQKYWWVVGVFVGVAAVAAPTSWARAKTQPPRSQERLRVDFVSSPKGKGHTTSVVLTNVGRQPFAGMHPSQHMAIGFVVLDALGNAVKAEGLAKVSPKRQRISLKPGASKTVPLTWRTPAAISFPFLSGSALFGYRLKKGVRYRVIVIYRPDGHQSTYAFTSPEKVIVLR